MWSHEEPLLLLFQHCCISIITVAGKYASFCENRLYWFYAELSERNKAVVSLIRKWVMQGGVSDCLNCCKWLFGECRARNIPIPKHQGSAECRKGIGFVCLHCELTTCPYCWSNHVLPMRYKLQTYIIWPCLRVCFVSSVYSISIWIMEFCISFLIWKNFFHTPVYSQSLFS